MVRHTENAAATVRVVREPGRLVVEVADNGPATAEPVAGNGIRGMVERARAVGGTVQVTARPGGGVLLRAELPVSGEAP